MARSIISAIPVLGFSALAVGSVGAPVPKPGHADVQRVQAAVSVTPSPIMLPSNSRGRLPAKPETKGQVKMRANAISRSVPAVAPATGEAANTTLLPLPDQKSPSAAVRTVPSPPVGQLEDQIRSIQPSDMLGVYGTGATNAYKTYFPQIDSPQIDTFPPAEGDARILTKNGSYFAYEDPPKDDAKPAEVIAPPRLTEPVLQKHPLDLVSDRP